MDATVASTPNNSASSLANSPTPPKKDRSSTRKTCQYCHKVSDSVFTNFIWFPFHKTFNFKSKDCVPSTIASPIFRKGFVNTPTRKQFFHTQNFDAIDIMRS